MGEIFVDTPPPVGKFQVITPKESTNEESSGYKHKEPYPNWTIPK